ncbi:hypothetical protein N7540_012207 [Penicillium herquei]|nr:hypothetical protein N7540_012207 [Penicillium herquei]
MGIAVSRGPQPGPDAMGCKAVETRELHSIEDFQGPELEANRECWDFVPVEDQVAEDTQLV